MFVVWKRTLFSNIQGFKHFLETWTAKKTFKLWNFFPFIRSRSRSRSHSPRSRRDRDRDRGKQKRRDNIPAETAEIGQVRTMERFASYYKN